MKRLSTRIEQAMRRIYDAPCRYPVGSYPWNRYAIAMDRLKCAHAVASAAERMVRA